MDKASKAIRRSGVRLRSMSSGNGNLQMVISQLGEVRCTFKSFALAQNQASEDLLQWAVGSHQNRVIEETFAHLAELAALWTEVQKDFADQLKDYRTQFELILEGERHVSQAREILAGREQREAKLRRELKKLCKKALPEEVRLLKEKLTQAERASKVAHHDVVERVSENEAVKMIRVKEGLVRVGASYCDLAQRCLILFTAHHTIAAALPDVHDKDLHDIKYTGGSSAMKLVQDAKDQVRLCRRSSLTPKMPLPEDPPPPYTPSVEHLDSLSDTASMTRPPFDHPSTRPQNPLYPSAPSTSLTSSINFQDASTPQSRAHNAPPSYGHATHQLPRTPHSSPAQNASGVLPSIVPKLRAPETPKACPQHLPEDLGPQQLSPTHSNSAPNLVEESVVSEAVGFPALSAHDTTCFNESTFHPDTSSSSPNLACSRRQDANIPETSPPYNPDYDWLPPRKDNNTAMDTQPPPLTASMTNGDVSRNQEVERKKVSHGGGAKGHTPVARPPSVRPRTSKNPFLDPDSDSDEGGEEGDGRLAEALKRTSVS